MNAYVLAACEQLALTQERQLVRDALALTIQSHGHATDTPKQFPAHEAKGNAADES